MTRRIAILTGARSDYGIFRPVIRALEDSPQLDPVLFVTGMHLAGSFGHTVEEIEADGHPIAARVQCLLDGTSGASMGRSFALAAYGLVDALERESPDLLLLLGDRFETFAAASAATMVSVPIAHIHGGERTEGAIDEQMRHAITKLSHVHFASTQEYAARIRQMGEDPKRVFVSGAPGLDGIRLTPRATRAELAAHVGFDPDHPMILGTYHPVTLAEDGGVAEFDELCTALEGLSQTIVFTFPNADAGSQQIRDRLATFAERPNVFVTPNLGARLYYTAMAEAEAMVGNSSSGILEAASFGLPVVNVGTRQDGRQRAENVIDVRDGLEALRACLDRALSTEFRTAVSGIANPYGDGHAAERIAAALADLPPAKALLRKSFVDLSGGDAASAAGRP